MDRRAFLRSFGTGVVATATVAEVGMWAEFMEWLRGPRKTYFIGADLGFGESATVLTYADVNAVTIQYISEHMQDDWFKASPFERWVHEDGGKMLVRRIER